MGRRRFSRAFKRAVAAEYIKSGVKRQEKNTTTCLPSTTTTPY